MESFLGISLMDRDAGSVRLTPKGETLLPRARRMIQDLDGFIGAAGNDALFEGTIRLGVTEMIAHAWLGRFLKALQDRFPNVLVELSVDISVNISQALFNRTIDLALQNEPFEQEISGTINLGTYPLIWVASPSLGLGKDVMSLSDMSGYTILTHAKGATPHEQLMQHLSEKDVTGLRLATSTNLAACQQMTIDGLGISCLPRVMVERDLNEGRLQALQYDWTPDDLSFAARFDTETVPSFVRSAAEVAADIAKRSKS